jgi:hypothetical protein
MSPWFRSEVTGVVLMALIFGLAHAPGFIFREAETVEGPWSKSFCLGYRCLLDRDACRRRHFLWRHLGPNKNLVALILIDAATDLLSNIADFVKIWNL